LQLQRTMLPIEANGYAQESYRFLLATSSRRDPFCRFILPFYKV
jgi:hypothetical protein